MTPIAFGAKFDQLFEANVLLSAAARKHSVRAFPDPFSVKSVVRGEATWRIAGQNFRVDRHTCLVVAHCEPCRHCVWSPHVRDHALLGRRPVRVGREELDFAVAWRSQPKWVVSHSLKAVGPNAMLVQNDVGTVLRELKTRLVGEIDVAGPDLARSLTDLGLFDAYRL